MPLPKISYSLLIFTGILFLFSCQGPTIKKSLSPEQQADYLAKGKKITMFSFKALSSEVIKAIETGGVQHAVDYCHLQANPLTDSLSLAYDAKISRVSDKNRNPANVADSLDSKIINAYRQQIEAGQELQPHLEFTQDEVIYYSPIIILNPLCLQCHGEPGITMDPANETFIKTKYPDDNATGYKLGDLRGVWKIRFEGLRI